MTSCNSGPDGRGLSTKNSEALKDNPTWTPPVYKKSPAAEGIIMKALASNILMKELALEDRVVTLALTPTRDFALALPLTSPSPPPRPCLTLTLSPNTPILLSLDADEGHGCCQVQAG